MRYFGGKAKTCKYIVPIIQEYIDKGNYEGYIEPFVGGANIIKDVKGIKRYGLDKHPQLIAMWQELQKGWKPPTSINKEEYKYWQHYKEKDSEHIRGFVGFGVSFAGKWFGGWAGNDGLNYAQFSCNSLEKKMKTLGDVIFKCRDYKTLKPNNFVIYLDPPYVNTTKYSVEFSTVEFWDWVRQYSKTNTILISEYTAPDDFECIWEMPVRTAMNSEGGKLDRVEKLFKLKETN